MNQSRIRGSHQPHAIRRTGRAQPSGIRPARHPRLTPITRNIKTRLPPRTQHAPAISGKRQIMPRPTATHRITRRPCRSPIVRNINQPAIKGARHHRGAVARTRHRPPISHRFTRLPRPSRPRLKRKQTTSTRPHTLNRQYPRGRLRSQSHRREAIRRLVQQIAKSKIVRRKPIGNILQNRPCPIFPRRRGRRFQDMNTRPSQNGDHNRPPTRAEWPTRGRHHHKNKELKLRSLSSHHAPNVQQNHQLFSRTRRPATSCNASARPGSTDVHVGRPLHPASFLLPPSHIPQATDTNPLLRCRAAPLLKNRSERRSAPPPGSAPPATENTRIPHPKPPARRRRRHCSWGRWPRFPHLAPRPHPSRHGHESASTQPAIASAQKSFGETFGEATGVNDTL